MNFWIFLFASFLLFVVRVPTIHAKPFVSKKSQTPLMRWLDKSKLHYPLLSYIPEFYDDNFKIKSDMRVQEPGWFKERLQLDIQCNVIHSKYNFTDLVDRYSREDGWLEFKVSLWLNEKKTFSPFLSIVPSFTTQTSENFWWQNYHQVNSGIQWYPFPENEKISFLKSVRFFAQYSDRSYYDKPSFAKGLKNHDVQIGFDYYYDDIFSGNPMAFSIWTSLAWYKTNFSILNPLSNENKNYNAIFSKGDAKYGPIKRWRNGIVFPYLTAQWTFSPKYEERFFENYLRIGTGVRYYPWAYSSEKVKNSFWKNSMKRCHIFGEYLYNACWLGDEPTGNIEDSDIRFGFGFSTSGFFRDRYVETKSSEKKEEMMASSSKKSEKKIEGPYVS